MNKQTERDAKMGNFIKERKARVEKMRAEIETYEKQLGCLPSGDDKANIIMDFAISEGVTETKAEEYFDLVYRLKVREQSLKNQNK